MRKRLFDLAAKLEKEEMERSGAIADLLKDCAENGEMWEVEMLVEVLHG